MAGPDPVAFRADLQALAEQLGMAERVHWPGMLRGEAKWGALHGCEAFVLPSHGENFGIAVVEALSLGRRVVTTDTSGFRELAEQGLVRAVPLHASADEIATVMASEIARSDASPEPIALPSWGHCADQLAELYRTVAEVAPR